MTDRPLDQWEEDVSGPFACCKSLSGTWNDNEWCDGCPYRAEHEIERLADEVAP